MYNNVIKDCFLMNLVYGCFNSSQNCWLLFYNCFIRFFFLTELSEQSGGLVARLKQQEDHLRSCSESRRLYETDYQKIEHWCNDTDIKCMGDLPLDCATEVLEVQHKEFKVRNLLSYFHLNNCLVMQHYKNFEHINIVMYLHDILILIFTLFLLRV